MTTPELPTPFDPITLALAGAVALFAISAAGSILGTGIAASAAIGAWKKCYAHNRPAPFTLLTFVSMPLTNSLYGMVLMFYIIGKVTGATLVANGGIALFGLCVFTGLVMAFAAYAQAKASACACDAQGETGQGFGSYLAAIGVIEGVTLFVLAFTIVAIGSFIK